MSPRIVKTIIVTLKVVIITYFMIRGLLKHCRVSNAKRNNKIIALFIAYLVLLFAISITELIFELIPMIYAILVALSMLQVYQLAIFFDTCQLYIPKPRMLTLKICLLLYSILYLCLLFLSFTPEPLGPKCLPQTQKGYTYLSRAYPITFVLWISANFLLWVFTMILFNRGYFLDNNLL